MSEVLDLPPQVQSNAQRLRTDFPYFARNCLQIRTKDGEIVPFKLNRAQLFLHEKLDAQWRKGKVRAIIVKGRQLGISTYLQGRFYWRLWRTTKALRAFILTHEQDATDNLFGMAQRFHDHMPLAVKPDTKAANAKELIFADSDCGYQVATAGSKEVGRSQTIQLLHGSEVPSWPNAESHVVSLLTTALAKTPESEGILEATAKGVGNVFHRMCMAAVQGNSEYEAIFIPWFWGEDYEEPCPASHHFSDEWWDYGRLHRLEWQQLYWAWKTNRELAQAKSLDPDSICPDFRQEYPATFEEAFQSSGNSFIPALSVMRARKPETTIIGRGPIILGVDPSRDVDKVGIIDRCGRRMGERICEKWPPEGNVPYLAQKLSAVIKKLGPDAVCIDTGSVGAAVYDLLLEMGYCDILYPVNFGSAPAGMGPTGDRMYSNRRAEMYDLMRDWFESPGGVQIPDRDDLHMDLTAPEWGPQATRYTTNNELVIEPKLKIKERLGSSPDLGDAAALTFSVPFATVRQAQNQPRQQRRKGRGGY